MMHLKFLKTLNHFDSMIYLLDFPESRFLLNYRLSHLLMETAVVASPYEDIREEIDETTNEAFL